MRSDKRGRPGSKSTRRARGVFWARVYLAVHLVLVLIPIAIVATWSVSALAAWTLATKSTPL